MHWGYSPILECGYLSLRTRKGIARGKMLMGKMKNYISHLKRLGLFKSTIYTGRDRGFGTPL
jgi:hypothetical protein